MYESYITLQTLKSQDANIRTTTFYTWMGIRWLSSIGYPGYVDYEVCGRLVSSKIQVTDWEIGNQSIKVIKGTRGGKSRKPEVVAGILNYCGNC